MVIWFNQKDNNTLVNIKLIEEGFGAHFIYWRLISHEKKKKRGTEEEEEEKRKASKAINTCFIFWFKLVLLACWCCTNFLLFVATMWEVFILLFASWNGVFCCLNLIFAYQSLVSYQECMFCVDIAVGLHIHELLWPYVFLIQKFE